MKRLATTEAVPKAERVATIRGESIP